MVLEEAEDDAKSIKPMDLIQTSVIHLNGARVNQT